MKWLSFNCRGLASPQKKLALKRLSICEPCDIIFLQENLGPSNHIVEVLLSIMPRWNFQAMDAVGRSGGLALGIKPHTIQVIASWGGLNCIGMDLFSAILGKQIRIINIYFPYKNRMDF